MSLRLLFTILPLPTPLQALHALHQRRAAHTHASSQSVNIQNTVAMPSGPKFPTQGQVRYAFAVHIPAAASSFQRLTPRHAPPPPLRPTPLSTPRCAQTILNSSHWTYVTPQQESPSSPARLICTETTESPEATWNDIGTTSLYLLFGPLLSIRTEDIQMIRPFTATTKVLARGLEGAFLRCP